MDINVDNVKSQMRKGLLEYCILIILRKGELYASQIIDELKKANLLVVEGTIYPLLIREKNLGILSYRWEESPQGPPRKYYSMTEKGLEFLSQMEEEWKDIVKTVETLYQ